MNKNGQVFIIFIYVLGIIAIGFALLVLSGPMKYVFEEMVDNEYAQDADSQEFFLRTKTIWTWLPLILIFPMILWAFSKAHERQGYG